MSRELKPCGTDAAYRRHRKAGEEPCGPCLEGRRAARRASYKPVPRKVAKCGTPSGHSRHTRLGETPCEACRAAQREKNARLRGGHRPRELKPCGTDAAYQRHRKAGEKPCEPCLVANRVAGRAAMRRSRASAPVEVPLVVQGPDGVGPCAVAANGFLWDPVRDDETPGQARERQRVAAAICLTQCSVFASCVALPGTSGVVAGVLPGGVR